MPIAKIIFPGCESAGRTTITTDSLRRLARILDRNGGILPEAHQAEVRQLLQMPLGSGPGPLLLRIDLERQCLPKQPGERLKESAASRALDDALWYVLCADVDERTRSGRAKEQRAKKRYIIAPEKRAASLNDVADELDRVLVNPPPGGVDLHTQLCTGDSDCCSEDDWSEHKSREKAEKIWKKNFWDKMSDEERARWQAEGAAMGAEVMRAAKALRENWEKNFDDPYPKTFKEWTFHAVRAGIDPNRFGKMQLWEVQAVVEGYKTRLLDMQPKAALRVKAGQPDEDSPKPRLFEGGQLVFLPDRIELCGIEICGGLRSGGLRNILEALCETYPDGGFRAFSAKTLSRKAGTDREDYAVGQISRFRKRVQQSFADRGVACDREDVIERGPSGYRLSSKITVRVVENAEDPLPATDGLEDDSVQERGAGTAGRRRSKKSEAGADKNNSASAGRDLGHDLGQAMVGNASARAAQRRNWILSSLRQSGQIQR